MTVKAIVLFLGTALLVGQAFQVTRPATRRLTKENSRRAGGESRQSSTSVEAAEMPFVNGENGFGMLENMNVSVPVQDLLPSAPPLSYDKYLTMQDKRVIVSIRYSGNAGLRPYFLTVARKIKASHPDVMVERLILPAIEEEGDEATFEVAVDNKVILGKSKTRRAKVASVDMTRGRSVFVSMQALDIAISRARRKRRPSTLYGDTDSIGDAPTRTNWKD